jgi:hypothetical protein
MSSSSVRRSGGAVRKLGRVTALALGVSSLVGGFTVLAGVTPAGASPTNVFVSPYGLDSNPCSASSPCLTLKHAYNTVATSGTINLAGGTYKGVLTISKNVNIVGPSSDGSLDVNTATIDALGGFDGIEVNSVKVTISDVVIDGVNNFDGDGVSNIGGTLTFNDVVIEDNVVSIGGGGLFNLGGKVTMNGGSLLENSTLDGTPGGGVYNAPSSTVILNSVSLEHNTAPTGTGGAIVNYGTLKLTGTTSIHDNSAEFDAGGIQECPGAGISVGPGVSNTNNTPADYSTDPSHC